VIEQLAEPLLRFRSRSRPPPRPASAGRLAICTSSWSGEPTRLIAADEPAVRQLLGRHGVPYRPTTAVFRPGRFSRGKQPPMSSVPVTSFDATWLVGLLQASDSFYPTGSYAHSFGLEGLVHAGGVHESRDAARFLLRAALPALRQTELPLAAHPWRAFGVPEWRQIGELCVLSSALRYDTRVRLAAESIGRQRAELVAGIPTARARARVYRRAAREGWPHSPAVAGRDRGARVGRARSPRCSRPGLRQHASVVAAAKKLLRLGQNGAQSLLTEPSPPRPRSSPPRS